MLENLGIRIDMSSLSTWPEYKAARDRLFGRRMLGRFWCRRIRPRLMPERQREYRARYDLARTAHQIEFMAEVLKRGEELGYTQ